MILRAALSFDAMAFAVLDSAFEGTSLLE